MENCSSQTTETKSGTAQSDIATQATKNTEVDDIATQTTENTEVDQVKEKFKYRDPNREHYRK